MVEKKPAPAAASAKTVGDGTNRLRMTRTATLFTLTTLLYFGSIIFYGASRATTPAERYVTGGDALYVEVAGCDVRVESGPRNEVDVERWIWHWAEVRWFYRSGGAKVWKVIVRNVVGCHNAPFFECDETCEVRVRVADDSARLVVRQGASDPVCKSNLQPDFNVSVFECFDTSTSAVLREPDESNRFVQKSAESTSI